VPSLREIEQTVAALWLNEDARTWLVKRKGAPPDCLKNAPPEILDTVDRKGVALYADLMNYGHQDVMASIYPYCQRLLGKQWESTVDDYLLRFPPEHYNFNRLCSRLPEYFTTYGGTLIEKHPFLPELADYEWIELEKMEQDAAIKTLPHSELSDLGQLAALRPLVNPTLTVRDYRFNILDIAARLDEGKRLGKAVQPERTFVAIYRHPQSHLCRFVELGEAAAAIIDAARGGLSYQQLIPQAVAALSGDPQQAVMAFLELVEEFQELAIFVGSEPAA
jgi:hypothetical protein